MTRLFRFEASKLSSYRLFWIVMLIYGLALVAASRLSNFNVNGVQANPGHESLFWVAGYIAQVFLGYFSLVFICNEFELRTLRQHIIDGISRTEYFFGKLFFFGALIIISMMFLITLGLLANSGPISVPNLLEAAIMFGMKTFAYLSMALLIGQYFKRTNSAIGVYFVWPFLAEPVAGWLLRKYAPALADWLPTEVFSQLARSPFSGPSIHFADVPPTIYLATLVYIIGFWAMAHWKFSKTDI